MPLENVCGRIKLIAKKKKSTAVYKESLRTPQLVA